MKMADGIANAIASTEDLLAALVILQDRCFETEDFDTKDKEITSVCKNIIKNVPALRAKVEELKI